MSSSEEHHISLVDKSDQPLSEADMSENADKENVQPQGGEGEAQKGGMFGKSP